MTELGQMLFSSVTASSLKWARRALTNGERREHAGPQLKHRGKFVKFFFSFLCGFC